MTLLPSSLVHGGQIARIPPELSGPEDQFRPCLASSIQAKEHTLCNKLSDFRDKSFAENLLLKSFKKPGLALIFFKNLPNTCGIIGQQT